MSTNRVRLAEMTPYRRKFGGHSNNILPKWNDSQTVKFFQLYEGHRCLWDGKDKDYRNPDARAASYQDIILEMNLNCDENLLRKKIKNIRTIYARELKEVKRTRKAGCPDPVYIPTLSWYNDADRFLRNIVSERTAAIPRKRSGARNDGGHEHEQDHLHEEENGMDDDDEEVEEDYLPADLLEGEMMEESQGDEEIRAVRGPSQQQSHSQPQSWRSSPKRSSVSKLHARKLNKFNRQSAASVSMAEKAITRLANMASAASSSSAAAAAAALADEDEFTTFGRLVSSQLRSMPFQRAILCQSKILTLLTEDRINWLTEDSREQEHIATTIVHVDPDGDEFIEVKGCN